MIFSYSGNTAELNNLLRYANRFNIKIIGVASKKDSLLLKASDVKILIPQVKEADPTKWSQPPQQVSLFCLVIA